MDLDRLIPLKFRPHHGCKWKVKGKYLMYHHYEHIPVAFIENDIVYVFLDTRIHNQIIKQTKWLMELGVEFYFTTPALSDPGYRFIDTLEESVIRHYLFGYSQTEFFYGFRKIGFDLIKNMVDWTTKEDCGHLIKDCYQEVNKKVQRSQHDWYQNKKIYDYKSEIRDDFNSLYRDIQINQIL